MHKFHYAMVFPCEPPVASPLPMSEQPTKYAMAVCILLLGLEESAELVVIVKVEGGIIPVDGTGVVSYDSL